MGHFSLGSATLFVEESGVSFVEYIGPTASMGETGGSLCRLEQLLGDTKTQAWIREKFGSPILEGALAEARRLLGK